MGMTDFSHESEIAELHQRVMELEAAVEIAFRRGYSEGKEQGRKEWEYGLD